MFDAIFPIDPTSFLLPFTKIFLTLISVIFDFLVMIGPFGQIAFFLIPCLLFMKDIYDGPKAFKHLDKQ